MTQKTNNQSNPETVNEVLEKIREFCDLKKLEFGCEIKRGDTWDMVTSSDPKGVWTIDEGYWLKNEITEIIGLPVQLNHLLHTLDKLAFDESPMLTVEGQFVQYNPENGELNLTGMWFDNEKSVEDNLRSNPELTKWVHGVIIK